MKDNAVADVVLGALVDEGGVLLVRRSPDKRAHPNVWDLPGGCVEEGESELGALERELHEELCVHILTDAVSHLYRLTTGPADEPVLVSALDGPQLAGNSAQQRRGGACRHRLVWIRRPAVSRPPHHAHRDAERASRCCRLTSSSASPLEVTARRTLRASRRSSRQSSDRRSSADTTITTRHRAPCGSACGDDAWS